MELKFDNDNGTVFNPNASNRTKVELKYLEPIIKNANLVPSNRTKVELKYDQITGTVNVDQTSNRTKVELK